MVPVNAGYLRMLQDGYAKLRERAQEAAVGIRSHAGTAKTSAMTAGVGALIGFLASLDDVKNQKFLKENWWLLPLSVLALGYYLTRKNNPHGRAVLAAGGVLLVNGYNANRNNNKAATPTPASPNTGSLYDDVGAVRHQLHPSEDGRAWLQAPSGQWVRVQLAPMLRQFGPALSTFSPNAVSAASATTQQDTGAPVVVEDPAARLAAAAFAS
jgi:hypothetical protein